MKLFSVLSLGMVAAVALGQQPATSGTFVLHKFAKAIGKETYAIEGKDGQSTLVSHFLFTDRGSKVPLETVFVQKTDLTPVSYTAKGKSSRLSEMEDGMTTKAATLEITQAGKMHSVTPVGPWYMTDGYSPVAMQQEMMRWWLVKGRPASFTVFPTGATVHIEPAQTLTVDGKAAHGYTVGGLIWGGESLWMDDDRNLVALVSTDAEFDHFEAVREANEAHLGEFIGAAVKSNLEALAKLSASAKMAPAKKLAIVGATLEDSTGAKPVADSVIVIEDGVITAVGTHDSVKVPAGATVVDAKGKFAIPGLWDMHAHYEQVEWGPIYLAAGVTSVRDVGNEFDFIRILHEQLDRKADPAIGPHLEFAGLIDGQGPMSLGAVLASNAAETVPLVDRYKAAGARQIKIYSSVTPDEVKAICVEAHRLGLTVTGHIPNGMTAIEGVDDGMDQINHIQYVLGEFVKQAVDAEGKPIPRTPAFDGDGAKAKELIGVLKDHHTVLDPTMVVFEGMVHTKPMSELEPGLNHVAPQLRAALDSPPAPPARAAAVALRWGLIMQTLQALHAGGVTMVAGTDQSIPGYSLHRELEIYVEAGFTPLEALQTATINAAKALGVEAESGSLGVGKRGDVLLLDADPLADIHNTRKVWKTVAAGAVYDPAPLWRSVGFLP